jgi:hypothetical protein
MENKTDKLDTETLRNAVAALKDGISAFNEWRKDYDKR